MLYVYRDNIWIWRASGQGHSSEVSFLGLYVAKLSGITQLCVCVCVSQRFVTQLYMSLHQKDWEHPDLYLQASASTKKPDGPCCLVLLSLWAGHAILTVTQAQAKRLMKTKVWSLRSAWLWWNSKLNTWFSPVYRIPHRPGAEMYWSAL